MLFMLCRNRTRDYTAWRSAFDSHAQAHRDAGLILQQLWRSTADPNEVHFLFEVRDRDRALQFVNDPAGAEAGEAAGVLDGEIALLESVPGY